MHNVTPIDPSLLARLEEGYSARPELGLWSSALSRTPLADAAFVPAAAAKLRPEFSVVVPTTGITNQKKSGRCWMFSTMNILRERVIRNCNLAEFALSGTYLAFYDKLEKANLFYENILHFASQKLECDTKSRNVLRVNAALSIWSSPTVTCTGQKPALGSSQDNMGNLPA